MDNFKEELDEESEQEFGPSESQELHELTLAQDVSKAVLIDDQALSLHVVKKGVKKFEPKRIENSKKEFKPLESRIRSKNLSITRPISTASATSQKRL